MREIDKFFAACVEEGLLDPNPKWYCRWGQKLWTWIRGWNNARIR